MKKLLLSCVLLLASLCLLCVGCDSIPEDNNEPNSSKISIDGEDSPFDTTALTLTEEQKSAIIRYLGENLAYGKPDYLENDVKIRTVCQMDDTLVWSYRNGGDAMMATAVIGDYTLSDGIMHTPNAIGLYVVTADSQVYTLQEACNQGLVDIGAIVSALADYVTISVR